MPVTGTLQDFASDRTGFSAAGARFLPVMLNLVQHPFFLPFRLSAISFKYVQVPGEGRGPDDLQGTRRLRRRADWAPTFAGKRSTRTAMPKWGRNGS